ncbi:hypothetical protein GCM10023238_31710 [Streptomyces heliomycini]
MPLEGLPFDPARGTVPHLAGGCCGRAPSLRASTWRAGSSGARRASSAPTGPARRRRWPPCCGTRPSSRTRPAGDPLAALRAEGVEPVAWTGWQAIERAEARLGASLGRSIVKLPDWESLLSAARGADE